MTWAIRDQASWEAELRKQHGDEQFERRLAVAKEKTDALTDWKEQMVMGTHFETIAMGLKNEHFEVAKDWHPDRWLRLAYKITGVS